MTFKLAVALISVCFGALASVSGALAAPPMGIARAALGVRAATFRARVHQVPTRRNGANAAVLVTAAAVKRSATQATKQRMPSAGNSTM